jgi:hypothetical protein
MLRDDSYHDEWQEEEPPCDVTYEPARLADLRRNIVFWVSQLDPELRARVEARIRRDDRIPGALFQQSMLYRDATLRAYLEVVGSYPDQTSS